MSADFPKAYLRRLRNDIPIAEVIVDILDIPSKISEGRFRFLCPLCREFDTSTNPATNLARCFRCQRNFNPIDITMVVKHTDFRNTVAFLAPLIDNDTRDRQTTPPQPESQGRSIRD